jgi:hypothetical protein
MNAARWFAGESLFMDWSLLGNPLCSLGFLNGYWMRPRSAKPEASGGFLGGEFGGGLNNCANGIAHLAGILTVGVINAPQLVARF